MTLFIQLVVFFMFLQASLLAEWNPSVLDIPDFTIQLTDPKYTRLKAEVISSSANNWCSIEKINLLMDLTLLTQPKLCVEVGVFAGSSILPVATTLHYLNSGIVFAVDAWSNKEAVKHLDKEDPNRGWWAKVDMQTIYRRFQKLIKKWSLKGFCIEVHKSSQQAIEDIPDGIDFLHLDGDYSKAGSLQDVELYLPKVKAGGYILLSNFYLMVRREQPKINAFCVLCEWCEVVASIEQQNAILFRKN